MTTGLIRLVRERFAELDRVGVREQPGIGFAELGPGDLGLSLGYVAVPRNPYPEEMKETFRKLMEEHNLDVKKYLGE